MFRGSSPHTVFAPTDSAFAKVDGMISNVNELRLLELHILPQARLTTDLRCGQTYRTINTLQDLRNNQRSKTRCVNGSRTQQLGPGNTRNGMRPTIGIPNNVFYASEFSGQDFFKLRVDPSGGAAKTDVFSEDVIACNGVIHVVDEVLLPGNMNDFSGPGYTGYAGYAGYSYYGNVPHSHYSGYMGSYYNNIPQYGSPYYYGPPGPPRRGYKAGKVGKVGKGFKGGKAYYYGPPPPPLGAYYNPYYRHLKGQEDEAAEKPMSDAEFFGVDGLANIEAKIESVKDEFSEKPDENRKRRLEAMLEPDGSVKV